MEDLEGGLQIPNARPRRPPLRCAQHGLGCFDLPRHGRGHLSFASGVGDRRRVGRRAMPCLCNAGLRGQARGITAQAVPASTGETAMGANSRVHLSQHAFSTTALALRSDLRAGATIIPVPVFGRITAPAVRTARCFLACAELGLPLPATTAQKLLAALCVLLQFSSPLVVHTSFLNCLLKRAPTTELAAHPSTALSLRRPLHIPEAVATPPPVCMGALQGYDPESSRTLYGTTNTAALATTPDATTRDLESKAVALLLVEWPG